MSNNDFYAESLTSAQLEKLKLFYEDLKKIAWKELAKNKPVKQQIEDFLKFSHEMLKIYEKDKHGLLDEYRQTQYEQLVLFCLILQTFSETLNNQIIQNEVKKASDMLEIHYPFDLVDSCEILDKIIDANEALNSNYNLTLILLKLANPISKKSGMREFEKLLSSLMQELPKKDATHTFVSVLHSFITQKLST